MTPLSRYIPKDTFCITLRDLKYTALGDLPKGSKTAVEALYFGPASCDYFIRPAGYTRNKPCIEFDEEIESFEYRLRFAYKNESESIKHDTIT